MQNRFYAKLIFSWKHLFCNCKYFFSKDNTFTKFLLKKRESNFHNYSVKTINSLTDKIIRQSNSEVISLAKSLLSRNFGEKSARERISAISTLWVWWKKQKFTAFWNIFREMNYQLYSRLITLLLKKLLNSWFDEIFFGEGKFLTFPYCAVCTPKYSHRKNISWN